MIRSLTPLDATAFKKLRLETLKKDPASWLSTFENEKNYPDSIFEGRINYWFHFPGFGYYGIFDGSTLSGYGLISPNSWANKKHLINLSDFCIAVSKRKKGLGKNL